MRQVLHGSARTTAAVRRAIQHSQESLNQLAKRYDLTANALNEDEQKCLDAGCTSYLTKPIKRATLLEEVRRHSKVASPP